MSYNVDLCKITRAVAQQKHVNNQLILITTAAGHLRHVSIEQLDSTLHSLLECELILNIKYSRRLPDTITPPPEHDVQQNHESNITIRFQSARTSIIR